MMRWLHASAIISSVWTVPELRPLTQPTFKNTVRHLCLAQPQALIVGSMKGSFGFGRHLVLGRAYEKPVWSRRGDNLPAFPRARLLALVPVARRGPRPRSRRGTTRALDSQSALWALQTAQLGCSARLCLARCCKALGLRVGVGLGSERALCPRRTFQARVRVRTCA